VLIWKHTEQNVCQHFLGRIVKTQWKTLVMIVSLWMKNQTQEVLTFILEKIWI